MIPDSVRNITFQYSQKRKQDNKALKTTIKEESGKNNCEITVFHETLN